MEDRTRILLVRGHHPTPWGLRSFEELPPRFDTRLLVTTRSRYDLADVRLPQERTRTASSLLPVGQRAGRLIAAALPDRLVGMRAPFSAVDIVHAEELSLWFSADAARAKRRHGFRLVLGVYETIPLLESFRSPYARRYRRTTLDAADLFLASTERARQALLLEGVDPDRIQVVLPGVDVERFSSARPAKSPHRHVIVSPGRLEWEKGHHDVIRGVAALRRGIVNAPPDAVKDMRLIIAGSGPERERLEAHAAELGVGDAVEIRTLPHRSMPDLYAAASGIVLASLPRSGCSLYPGDVPRCFWEEQFGLVIAEAMAAGLPLLLSASGSIPEVAGETAHYFAPGDWMAIARKLAEGPLARPPGQRIEHPSQLVQRYSTAAAAARFAEAYDRVMAMPPFT